MLEFLGRWPFVILGALGFVSLVSGLINLSDDFQNWVTAWQSVTYPIWEFTFGWAFRLFGVSFPDLIKDYLTLGLIVGGMCARSEVMFSDEEPTMKRILKVSLLFALTSPIAWPFYFWLYNFTFPSSVIIFGERKIRMIFWETGVVALILIAINYVVLFHDYSQTI